MPTATAPGKVILLGEHAVVFGQPAIAAAINLRLRCRATRAEITTLNGAVLSDAAHPYVSAAVRLAAKVGGCTIVTDSEIPSGSGLGSSAAVCVAALAALTSSGRGIDYADVATKAFEVESQVQGRASPIDTSVSTHGQGVLVDKEEGEGLLWHIKRDTREWYVHHCPVPNLSLVVGYTGVNAPTGPLVAKVKRYYDRTVFARDIVEEIGQLTREAIPRMKKKDVVGLGELMTRDHRLLAVLGVSTPLLDKFVEGCLPYSYGAKLTGAGGGGSMIALTDRPDKVVEVIRSRGGTPYAVRIGEPGVRLEP
ncbi:MAG: mevalonate kinase [Methanomassiliicoccales archaeon]|nr:mevalonate kinase [Methanomassiliicoccales archaeon]